VYIGFWWGNLRKRDHLEDTCIDVRITLTLYLLMWRIWRAPNNAGKGQMGFNLAFKGLRWIFKKWDVGVWNGLIWLRIGTSGRHLWMW